MEHEDAHNFHVIEFATVLLYSVDVITNCHAVAYPSQSDA